MLVPHAVHEISLVAATLALALLPPAVLAGAFLIVRRLWGRSFWTGLWVGGCLIGFLFAVAGGVGLAVSAIAVSTALLFAAAAASLVLVAFAIRWAFDDWLRRKPDAGTPLAWPPRVVAFGTRIRSAFSNDVVRASSDS